MNREQIVHALKLIRAENIQPTKRTGWVVSRCPLGPWRHEDGVSGPEVFGVRIEKGDPHTNCFSCGWHGSFGDLVLTMRHLNKKAPHVEVKWGDVLRLVEQAEEESEFDWDTPDIEDLLFGAKEEPHYFPDWWLDSFPHWSEIKWARQYLSSRDVPQEVADFLDLRADTKEKRVCFPVRDFSGNLVGLHGRAVEDGVEPRYRMYTYAGKNNPIFWLGEHWVDLTKPIVVVEGPFDVASVLRVYPNVVTPLFANPSAEKLRRMADALEWITIFDRGKGGDSGRKKVDSVLKRDHVIQHLLPPEGRKDPGGSTIEELTELLSGYIKLVV